SSEIITRARTEGERPPGWVVLPLSRNSVLVGVLGWFTGVVLGLGLFGIMAYCVIPHNYQYGIIPALITTLFLGFLLFVGLGSLWAMIMDTRRLLLADKYLIVITPNEFIKQEGEKIIHVPLMYVRHVTARGAPPPDRSTSSPENRPNPNARENVLSLFSGRAFTSSGMGWRMKRMRTPTSLAFVDSRSEHEVMFVDDIIVSSVVPPLTPVFQELAQRYFGKEAITVDHTMDLGIKYLIDNPWELGSDRIVISLAAHHLYGGPAIIIAFSTATTFDVISAEGDFLGGAIAPGLVISAEALSSAASRLFRVDLTPPRSALGKNTIENMQSGIIFGHVGLVQGLISRLRKEIPGVTGESQVKVIAHGGLGELMAPIIPEIQHVNPFLPLEGLRLAYARLRG